MNQIKLKRNSIVFILLIMMISVLMSILAPSTAAGDTAVANQQGANPDTIQLVGHNQCDTSQEFDRSPDCQQTLQIAKSASPEQINAGRMLTYTLVATNDTPGTLTNVTISDTIEANQTYVGGSATCGGNESGGVVTFPLGTMTSAQSVNCSFQVSVDIGAGSTEFFFDDMESGPGNWSTSGIGSTWAIVGTNPHNGVNSWFGQNVDTLSDQYLTMANQVVLTGVPILRVWHQYDLENEPNTTTGYDGGVIEISTNGGVNWSDLGANMTQNGYNSSISNEYDSPILGRPAFSGNSGGYIETLVDLSSYVGQSVLIRFRLATDSSYSHLGWFVDDVHILDEEHINNTACITSNEGANACDAVTTLVLPLIDPNFMLAATPATTTVCLGDDGEYTIDLMPLNGLSDPVTLSANSTSSGANVSFGTNPVPLPGNSLMTVSNPSSSYTFEIQGTAASITHTASVQLDLVDIPGTVILSSPIDWATGVPLMPTFTWAPVQYATSYAIEIATDVAFTNIVESAAGLTNSSYIPTTNLAASTLYYWRVRANNSCGVGTDSAVYGFITAANPICSTPNLVIPDDNLTGVQNTLIITSADIITDLDISLKVNHTWVGDLQFMLEHENTGTAVTFIDRPGVPASLDGCPNDNINVLIDDEGSDGSVETTCNSFPALSGSLTPAPDVLSAFDGENLSGSWTLTAADHAFQDTGIIVEWCILGTPDSSPQPQINANPNQLQSTQAPDTQMLHAFSISNTGIAPLNWLTTEDSNHGPAQPSALQTVPESREKGARELTAVMQNVLADQQPPEPLTAMAATPCISGNAGGYPCNNVDLMAFVPLADIGGGLGNDIWGWTGCGDREFALMGRTNGTAFVEITVPDAPVYLGNLSTHTYSSTWRDIKTYADHAFIVSEASSHGMQVFDLNQLCSVANPPVTFSSTAHYSGFGNAHNIVINEDSGYAYGVGTNSCSGGLHMVDISVPTSPTNAGCFSADGYTHDAQCVNYIGPDLDHAGKEICFNANEDTLTIVDVTNKGAPVQLSRTGYGGSSYTHQGWVTEDHATYIMNDELDEQNYGHNTRTRLWDISDLDAPTLIGFHDGSTPAIDHNLYVKGAYVYQANYRAGLQILDISDVANGNMSEVANFDIYPSNNSASFNGAWSNYPYFASDIVVVSGKEQGLFVLRPALIPDFVMNVIPDPLDICLPNDAVTNVDIDSIAGFTDPVTLSASGEPNSGSLAFTPNPITPLPGSSTMTISNLAGAVPGTYTITITGTASSGTHAETVQLNLFEVAPAATVTLLAPSDAATGVVLQPTFTWTAVSGAADYLIEIASDVSFTNIVTSTSVAGTSYTPATPLSSSTNYYWRVTAQNPCGIGSTSVAFSFTTISVPACTAPVDIPWASVTPNSGTINPSDSTDVDVTFDSTGLIPDVYTGTLCIGSNDFQNPVVALPLSLTVEAICSVPEHVSDVGISDIGSSIVQLDWTAVAGANQYEVWSAINTPYFNPSGGDCNNPAPFACAVVTTNSYQATHLGLPGDNHSYVVLASNSCGVTTTTLSNFTGEFDFNIEVGDP